MQPNLNAHVTDALAPLLQMYAAAGNDPGSFRTRALERTIATVSRLPWRLTRPEDARRVPGLAAGGIEKVEEVLRFGYLSRAHDLASDPRVRIMSQFLSVYGVGAVIAKSWFDAGARSLQDVLRLHEEGKLALSAPQRVGIALRDDFEQRIPRVDSERVAELVASIVSTVAPGALCMLGGSFRRGADWSSDFDVVIGLHANDARPPEAVGALVYSELLSRGFITHTLTEATSVPMAARRVDATGCEDSFRWRGVCMPSVVGIGEQPVHRRIDMQVFAFSQTPYAIVAWTGNTAFSRTLRAYCNALGYELTDTNLLPASVKSESCATSKTRNNVAVCVLPRCVCERDVFAFLGLEYVAPSQRTPFNNILKH